MKFNLSDFLQLDTKELLAVNGGYNCNGSTNNTVYPNTYYSGGGNPTPNGGGSSGDNKGNNTRQPVRTVHRPSGTWDYYGKDYGIWTDNYGEKHPFGPIDCTKTNNNKATNNSSSSSGGGSCSTPSSSPDSSSGKSNNPDGQGPSTTSSNPEKGSGDKEKKDNTPHGGGTCPGKDGGTHIPPSDDGSGTGDGGTETPNGGGICGGTGGSGEGEKPDNDGEEITNPDDTIDKTSGSFGQITDGSYADELTMQYYKNGNIEIGPFYCETPEIAKMHDSEMNGGLLFSQKGCLMTCTAKTVSQECDDEIYLRDINRLVDTDADGNLTTEEIAKGIDFFLDRKYGDIYDVIGKDIYNVSISDLDNASIKTEGDKTYVFGNAPDCHGGHWVVLEGYSTNENGQITFSYDGSSDNDIGRTFIMGKANQDSSKEIWGITRIQTFTIHRK